MALASIGSIQGREENLTIPRHKDITSSASHHRQLLAAKHKIAGATDTATDEGEKQTGDHAVVLVHGFANDEMMIWGFQVAALGG